VAPHIGSIGLLHDKTVNSFQNLQTVGIEAKLKEFDGCYHGFESLCAKFKPAGAAKMFIKESFDYAVKNYFKEN